jgi:hypothetical protein
MKNSRYKAYALFCACVFVLLYTSLYIRRQRDSSNTCDDHVQIHYNAATTRTQFNANIGDEAEDVKYYLDTREYRICALDDKLIYRVRRGIETPKRQSISFAMVRGAIAAENDVRSRIGNVEVQFIKHNKNIRCNASSKRAVNIHHFKGEKRSITNVSYDTILYENLYDNISLRVISNENIKTEYTIKYGGVYKDIALKYCGSDSITLSEAGDLQIYVNNNLLTEKAPFVYQDSMGYRLKREARYLIVNNVVSYEIQNVNIKLEMVIDPEMITYYGGNNDDGGSGISIINDSMLVVCLSTYSIDMVKNKESHDTSYNGNCDIFVSIINCKNGDILRQTYYGGSQDDYCVKLYYVDSAIVLIGNTRSSDLAITNNAINRVNSGMLDNIIVVLNCKLDMLIYSTYIGGKADDEISNAQFDNNGYLYISGWTSSNNFPTTNSAVYRSYRGGIDDAYCMKISKTYDTILYSTYYGGNGFDEGRGITIDKIGNIVMCGYTTSDNLPIRGSAMQTELRGTEDGFIVIIDSTGKTVKYSSYFGGSDSDVLVDVVYTNDKCYVFLGKTYSSNLPVTSGVIQDHLSYLGSDYKDQDICLLKCSAQMQMQWCTYLGGKNEDEPRDIVKLKEKEIAFVGYTYSNDYPETNSYYKHGKDANGIFTIVNEYGTQIVFSCIYGGDGFDMYNDISTIQSNIAICGTTESNNIQITMNAIQKENHGRQDAILWIYNIDTLLNMTDAPLVQEDCEFRLTCYPNPCTNKITVKITASRVWERTITVYDLSGAIQRRIELSKNDPEISSIGIDISSMQSGIYFVQLISGKQYKLYKVIKI